MNSGAHSLAPCVSPPPDLRGYVLVPKHELDAILDAFVALAVKHARHTSASDDAMQTLLVYVHDMGVRNERRRREGIKRHLLTDEPMTPVLTLGKTRGINDAARQLLETVAP